MNGTVGAGDIAAVIEALSLDDVTIVGWSFGGYVGSGLSAQSRKRARASVNLVGSPGGLIDFERTPRDDIEVIMAGSRLRGSLDLADNIEGYRAMPDSLTAVRMSSDDRESAFLSGIMKPSYVRRALTDLPLENADMVDRIDVSVLLSMGERDREWPIDAARRFLGSLRSGVASQSDDSDHFPVVENPSRFNAELAGLASPTKTRRRCNAEGE